MVYHGMSYERLNKDNDVPHTSIKSQVLNEGTEDQLTISGFQESLSYSCIYHLCAVFSFGILYLLVYWRPDWGVRWKKKSSLADAGYLVLKDADCRIFTVQIHEQEMDPSFSSLYSIYRTEVVAWTSYGSMNRCPESALVGDKRKCFIRYFTYEHIRYVWVPRTATFERLQGLGHNETISSLLNNYCGYSVEEQIQRSNLHGINAIRVDIKSYYSLLVSEVLNPFYIFQVFSIVLWMYDDYYLYSVCIFFISCISVGISLVETRKQSVSLRDMVESSNTSNVSILRSSSICVGDGGEIEVSATDLVPGDVLVLPPQGCVMTCDAVLICGNAIVNESMLTGESVPVTKIPLEISDGDLVFSVEAHKRHTIFSGTTVIQTRYYGNAQVLAVVIRTGFSTSKGELVRSIMFPRPLDFKFYQDSLRFIGFMFCIASIGMAYSIWLHIDRGDGLLKTVVRTLDIVTIVVPPALPAAVTVGTYYAQARLKKLGIFCISPPRINVAGKLKSICFDKTGTLTEDGLEVWGIIPIVEGQLGTPSADISALDPQSPLLAAMASCHSLTYVNTELVGDPLDLKMFEITNWSLEEAASGPTNFDQMFPTVVKPRGREMYVDPPDLEYLTELPIKVPYEIGIVRQFPFSSQAQRMSVIVRVLGQTSFHVFVKGAPEVIQTLCCLETLPGNLNLVLNHYTEQGFRVIALATRSIRMSWHAAQRAPRDQVECELTFLGLLILQNMLKPETAPIIQQLRHAQIRIVMVTGDNLLTALSVSRECGMIDHGSRVLVTHVMPPAEGQPATLSFELTQSAKIRRLQVLPMTSCKNKFVSLSMELPHAYHFAMTGKTWSLLQDYFPDILPWVVERGTIYARMAPDQKAQLVEALQALDYVVGMCGDGANDCGALKVAHVGISLSESEASVAAPFTSRVSNISCVPLVMCEGRGALTTSFTVFKYMALYSIIQFVSVLIMYSAHTSLSDPQFLYIDLCIIFIALFMGYTEALYELVPKRPLANLLGFANLFSVMSQVFLVIMMQVIVVHFLWGQYWYDPVKPSDISERKENSLSWETTTLFYLTLFQYLSVAVIYSPGKPFRKPLYTNVWLLVLILVLTFFNALLVFDPQPWQVWLLSLVTADPELLRMYQLTLVLLAAMHLLLAYIAEYHITCSKTLKKFAQWVTRKRQSKNLYKRIQREMDQDPKWPPIGTVWLSSERHLD